MRSEVDDSLLIGYINDTITPKERQIVEQWIMLSAQNRHYFIELDSANDAMKLNENVFNSIDVDSGYRNVVESSNKRSLSYGKLLLAWQKIAAVLLLPIAIAFCAYVVIYRDNSDQSSSGRDNIVWQEIVSPSGARVNVDLSDGTKVVLNANSKLRFPVVFDSGKREVELSGEAYFDVVSDKENPFTVKCAQETIIATGTAFNIEAYEWDTLSMVILERGVVDVAYNDRQKSVRLMANERLTYNCLNGSVKREVVDAAQLTAWRDGRLIFRNEKLSEIMRKIGMIYNLDIVFADKNIMNNVYHATFENESLREILRLMKMSMPIDFVDIDRKLQPSGDYTRHKIIIKNK